MAGMQEDAGVLLLFAQFIHPTAGDAFHPSNKQIMPCSVVAVTLAQRKLPGLSIPAITQKFLPLRGSFQA